MTTAGRLFDWVTGQSLAAFLARGVVGIGMITFGFIVISERPYVGLFAIFLGLVPLGGCPTCWLGGTIGAACEWRAPKQPPAQ